MDHAADCRGILQFNRVVDSAQTQALNCRTMILLGANHALDERHLDFFISHDYPKISETVLPRFAAISEGVFIDCSPCSVARTML